MMSGRFSGIKYRTLLLGLLPAALLALGLTWYFTHTRLADLRRAFDEQTEAVTRQLAAVSLFGVFTRDMANLQQVAEPVYRRPDVVRLSIHDPYGKVLLALPDGGSGVAQSFRADNPATRTLMAPIHWPVETPVIADYPEQQGAVRSRGSEVVGSATVEFSYQPIIDRQTRIVRTSALWTVLGLGLAALFSLGLSRRLVRPIEALTESVRRVQQGALEVRVQETSSGELGALERGFNDMVQEMEKSRSSLEDQVEQATSDLMQNMEILEIQNVELELARKRAVQASQAKSEFLASISHEIRTPMNGVVGFLDLLAKTPLNPSQQEFVRVTRRSASGLMEIIGDILDFSQLEAGRLTLEQANFELHECLDDVMSLMSPLAHEKGLELVLLVYGDVPRQLQGDVQRLRQILVNLVSNAVKFTPSGEVVVRVMVEHETSGRVELGFAVSDTGIGIPKSAQAQLFEAFEQGALKTRRAYGGTGLGLSISRKLARAMGGSLSLESRVGAGSTFTARVRLQRPRGMGGRTRQADISPRIQTRVLLYDAHRLSLLALHHQLSALGLDVRDCATLADFKTELSSPHDLLILGLGSEAGANGLAGSALEECRRMSSAPILVLASRSEQEVHETYMAMGATRSYSKPVSQQHLSRVIQSLLLRRQTGPQDVEETSRKPAAVPDFRGRCIGVADDNLINRKLLQALLERTGAEVLLAEDGAPTIQWVEEGRGLDVLILDVHMPNMDGLDAARCIRALPQGERLPLVALTADATEETREQVHQAGMNARMVKPVEEQALWQVLEDCFGASPLRMEAQLETPPQLPVFAVRAQPNETSARVRDERRALEIAGGNRELAAELLQVLLQELDERHRVILQAHDGGDWEQLRDHAHKLRGAVTICALPALQRAVADLEDLVNAHGYDAVAAQVELLSTEVRRVFEMSV